MLYIGNFSYNDSKDGKDNFVLMPAVVKAKSADKALQKFADLFANIRQKSDLLDGAHEIFLDSLVEFDGAPKKAVLVQWEKIVPASDGLCSITAALPETDLTREDTAAYSWESDDVDDEDYDFEDLDELDLDALTADDEIVDHSRSDEPFLQF